MKKLILGLLFAVSGFGQTSGANVINVLIQNPTALVPGAHTITSSTLQNIGQTSHQVIMVLVNGDAVRGVTVASAQMQGSIDGTTWFAIGPVYASPIYGLGTFVFNVSGYRAYPYLRFTTTVTPDANNVSTTLSLFYVGNSSPSLVIDDSLGSISNLTTNGISAASSTTNVSLTGNIFAGQKATLYGLVITAPSTGTLFTLTCTSDGIISSSAAILILATNAANLNFIWPVGVRPYFQCPNAGDQISYKFTGTGGWVGSISFRGE